MAFMVRGLLIWSEETEADDAGRVTVVRPGRDVLPTRPDPDARVLLFVFERIGLAVAPGDALVEPEAKAVLPWAGALAEAGLVHQPEIAPAIVTAVVHLRVV